MESLIFSLNSTMPLFFLMLLGYLLHRAGVSAYTAACAFACTCVFGKQSLPPGLCHPQKLPQQVCSPSGVSLKPKERE